MPQDLKSSQSRHHRRKPAHRAEVPLRRRFASVGGILVTTAIIGTGAFFGLAGAGETYASFTGTAQSSSAAVKAGDMTVVVGDGSNWSSVSTAYAIDTLNVGSLFPGDFVQAPFLQIKLNGAGDNLASNVSIRTLDALPTGWQVHVAPGACSAKLTGAVVDNTQEKFLGVMAPGGTLQICAQLSLAMDAPSATQGTASGPVKFIITAKQNQP